MKRLFWCVCWVAVTVVLVVIALVLAVLWPGAYDHERNVEAMNP